MPENPALVETIVTTDMAKAIAKAYNVALIEVLTGFKYIGEQIKFFEQSGAHNYVFGWRRATAAWLEHNARDKDACVAVMMLCEVLHTTNSRARHCGMPWWICTKSTAITKRVLQR